jgi:hypothetical protein
MDRSPFQNNIKYSSTGVQDREIGFVVVISIINAPISSMPEHNNLDFISNTMCFSFRCTMRNILHTKRVFMSFTR